MDSLTGSLDPNAFDPNDPSHAHASLLQDNLGVLDPDLTGDPDIEHVQAPVVGDRYVSHEQVRVMLDHYARHEGFAVSVRASNKINYRWQCVHGGTYRNTRKGTSGEVTLVGLGASSGDDGNQAINETAASGQAAAAERRALYSTPGAQVIRATGTGPTGRTRRHVTKRTNCPWLVRAGMDEENLWKITKIVLEHNHALSPANPDVYHQNRPPGLTASQAKQDGGGQQQLHTTTLEETVMRPASPLPGSHESGDPSAGGQANYGAHLLGMQGLPVNAFLNTSFATTDPALEEHAVQSSLQIEVLTQADFAAQGLQYTEFVPFTKDAATQTEES